jgi:acetylornithine/N-succinyldiaminopimelate aminotransferase
MAVGNVVYDELTSPASWSMWSPFPTRCASALAGVVDAHSDKVEELRGRGLLVGLKLKDGFVQ